MNNQTKINEIADLVRIHRKNAGLTQKELADIAGVGKATIWDLEHAKATVRFETIARVLDALNIRIRLESPMGK